MSSSADVPAEHISNPHPTAGARVEYGDESLPFSPGCAPAASLLQGGSGDRSCCHLWWPPSAEGLQRANRAFLLCYLKRSSGLNTPDKALSWAFQHLLLALIFSIWALQISNQPESFREHIPQESFQQVWFSSGP